MKLPGDSSWNHPQLSSSFHKSEISVLILDLKTGLNMGIYKKETKQNKQKRKILKTKQNKKTQKPLKRKQPKKNIPNRTVLYILINTKFYPALSTKVPMFTYFYLS